MPPPPLGGVISDVSVHFRVCVRLRVCRPSQHSERRAGTVTKRTRVTRLQTSQYLFRLSFGPHKREMPPTTTPGGAAASNSFRPLPSGTLGFEDGLDFLAISKDAPAVKSLAFVQWVPVPATAGAPAATEVAAPRSLITAALCLGARVAVNAAATQAWRAAEPLTTRLKTATLSQHANYLHSIGTFLTTFKDQVLYRKKLEVGMSVVPLSACSRLAGAQVIGSRKWFGIHPGKSTI